MNNHLDRQQMLAYLDGELSRAETHRAEEHLHSCWTCRTEVEHLKDDIATILDSQKGTFSPALPPPPGPWPAFNMLVARTATAPQPNIWMRLAAAISTIATPSRVLAVSVAAIGIVLFTFATFKSQVVSAKEVLRRIEVADVKRSEIVMTQVIRERVHIRKTTRSFGRQDSTIINTWKSRKAAYWETSKDDAVVSDLEAEYKSHGVPVSLPLSASSATEWGKAIGGEPTVSRQGSDLDLTYAATPSASPDSIRQVSFLIQPDTWTVKQMTLALPDTSFEVTEDNFDIVLSSSVPPLLLAELELAPFPAVASEPVIHPLPRMGHNIVALPMDLDSVELDVFSTLHRLHADLGEPVTVAHSSRKVEVGVWQLPPDRQNEIRMALQNEPGVLIQTSRPIQRPQLTAAASSPIPSPAPTRITLPSDDEDQRLVKFFGDAEKEQTFTRDALAKSTNVLAHLYALRNLQAQFPPEREQTLSPTDQAQLASIIRDHAVAVSSALSDLQSQLSPLNGTFNVAATSPGAEADSSGTRWQDASLDALGVARSADHLLRDVLTTSETPAAPDAALPELQQKLSHLAAEMRALQKK
jgi:hypothetical protein